MSAAKELGAGLVRRAMAEVARRAGKRRPGYRANYGDATPEDVAWLMLMKDRVPFKKTTKEGEEGG